MDILRPEQHAAWTELLDRSCGYDCYHLPEYHALAEQCREGAAHLFVHSEGDHFIALPLLLRSLDSVPGVGTSGMLCNDATSVYGYAGPVTSPGALPERVLSNFRVGLRSILSELRVVSVFSRLHPLLDQAPLLAGLGECRPLGQTVSVDLTLPEGLRFARYSQNHRRNVNKLRARGATCLHDDGNAHLEHFIHMYYETMRRVNADRSYFFDPSFFHGLVSRLGRRVHLCLVQADAEVVCGGLFLVCGNILQYFLGATSDRHLRLSPMKFLLHTMASWGQERGLRTFHLGGGRGGSDDPLFRFKAGFSDIRPPFFTWRWVLSPATYERLNSDVRRWNQQHGLHPAATDYFPEYRCPAVPHQGRSEATIFE